MEYDNAENILKAEDVKAKGYGVIAQAVMFDRSISVQSKAIYAYLASYTGAERTAFPKRETILSDLKISQNTFYRHFKPLVENGYIKVSKAKGFKNKNVYTLYNNPKKLDCKIKCEKEKSLLAVDGINAQGFGFIPKLIMCDKRLPIKAKGLIAFLYSLVQSGCRAFPHRSTICLFLGLSKDTYYKALNRLTEYNYITVRQRHLKNGRFSVSDYILNSNPNREPSPENDKVSQNDRVLKIDTLPCPENEGNNNITSINNSYNKSSSNQELSYIPYTQDREEIREMIFNLTDFEDYSAKTDEFSKRYCKTVYSLIEMLCVPDHACYNRQYVSTVKLFEYLNDCLLDDILGLSLRDLIMQTVWHYDICSQRYKIKRPTEYLKALLWDEIYNFNL